MRLTITVAVGDRALDIGVDSGQRIGTTLQVLKENTQGFPEWEMIESIRLSRGMKRILPDWTYEQSDVHTGDALYVLLKDEEVIPKEDTQCDILPESAEYTESVSRTYAHSGMRASDEVDYIRLALAHKGLLDCIIYDVNEDTVTITYDTSGMKPMEYIHNESMEHRYAFLINLADTLDALDEYDITLTEDNICYDRNCFPYFMTRDIRGMEAADKLHIYRSVTASVLGGRHKAEEYIEGGLETVSDAGWFRDYMSAKSTDELKTLLENKCDEYLKSQSIKRISISRPWNTIRNIFIILLGMLLLIWGTVFFTLWYPQMRDNACLVKGQQAFIRREYINCIDAMTPLDMEHMEYDAKYILAVSYARAENLSRDEITEITERLSLTSSEKEYDYWIHLGRGEYTDAESDAKLLMDDRLLAYAYMKEYNHLESNENISGDEKESRMDELKSAIENMAKEYESEEEE